MIPIIGSFRREYRFLSNFYPTEIELDNKFYRTVEHAYQASKTTLEQQRVMISLANTPGEAKKLGRHLYLRPNWEGIKLNIMLDLLRQKFSIPDFKEKLLATKDATLIEGNDWGDRFWGVYKGEGENNLGKLLMKIRREISGS